MKQYYIKYSTNNPTQEVIHCSDKDTFGVAIKLQKNGVDISSDIYLDGTKLSGDAYGYDTGVVSMTGTASYENHSISAVSDGKSYNFNLGIQSHNTGKGEMNDAVGLTAIPSTLNVSTLNTSTLSASGNAAFSNGLNTGTINSAAGNTAMTIDSYGNTTISYGNFPNGATFSGVAIFSCAATFNDGLNTGAIRDTSGTTAMTIDSYGATFSGGATFLGAATFSGGATFPNEATFSGGATFPSDVSFSGDASFSSSASFSGCATFSGSVSFSGCDSSIYFGNDVTLQVASGCYTGIDVRTVTIDGTEYKILVTA